MKAIFEIQRATNSSTHHFFGFHDLVQTNKTGDLLLCLETHTIERPPYPDECISAGVVRLGEGVFYKIHDTCAFNFPQGARQQWVGDSDFCLCNTLGSDKWGATLSDARSLKVEDVYDFPVHCLEPVSGNVFFPDYRRLYGVGGYGYIGLRDPYQHIDLPEQCGIGIANIKTKVQDLLVSIQEVAACAPTGTVLTNFPHYVTHLVLNPAKTRLAFLHRYRVPDGGETTRLMTIGTDGSGLRCLAKGFLSHFDWLDDENIFIWGLHHGYDVSFRERKVVSLPLVHTGFMFAKTFYRCFRRVRGVQTIAKQDKSFLKVKDCELGTIEKVAKNILVEDGHPMVNPINRNWMVNDTYPNAEGIRTLMLYNITTGTRIDVGQFKMSGETPKIDQINHKLLRQDIDNRVCQKYTLSKFLFSRSGLHCDLHPRWSADGKKVFFDSIHEGTRQVYMVDVAQVVANEYTR